MYWNKDVKYIISPIIAQLRTEKTSTFKTIAVALMGLIAALFQSAGGLIPGIGMLISPFATAPIIIGMLFGTLYGLMGYVLTIFLLLLIQPSELIIFPFTTGLIAIGIGLSLILFKKRWQILSFSGLFLLIGICTLLYGIQFPVLGPFLIKFNFLNLISIYLFSLLYSWVWTELVIRFLPTIFKILVKVKIIN